MRRQITLDTVSSRSRQPVHTRDSHLIPETVTSHPRQSPHTRDSHLTPDTSHLTLEAVTSHPTQSHPTQSVDTQRRQFTSKTVSSPDAVSSHPNQRKHSRQLSQRCGAHCC